MTMTTNRQIVFKAMQEAEEAGVIIRELCDKLGDIFGADVPIVRELEEANERLYIVSDIMYEMGDNSEYFSCWLDASDPTTTDKGGDYEYS